MKRAIKKLLIPLLASAPLEMIGRQLLAPSVPVFMLHRTPQSKSGKGSITTRHLHNCLQYLQQRNYRFLSLEQLVESLAQQQPLPPKSVVFTMDDGYYDQAEAIAPVFLEHDCPLTFFVITGMLDQDSWPWDAKVSWIFENAPASRLLQSQIIQKLGVTSDNDLTMLRRNVQTAMKSRPVAELTTLVDQLANDAGISIPEKIPQDYRPMSWQQARRLEQQGIRFAPHSVHHGILSNMDEATMQYEITESWRIIRDKLEQPLNIFCYPNGRATDFGERDIRALQSAGYRAAVTTIADHARASRNHDDLFRIPRLALPDNLTEFIQYCSWLESARKARHNH